MSSNCPKCSAPINEDFGLTVCAGCGASVFVEMDGGVRVNEASEMVADEAPVVEFAAEPQQYEELVPEENFGAAAEEERLLELPVESAEPAPSTASGLLSEIAEFGNQDLESSTTGIYQYTLILNGIDTKEVREAVKEALTDSRFNWQADQVLSQIHRGSLILPQLNPVKASVLINRLKHLELDIKWEQNDLIS